MSHYQVTKISEMVFVFMFLAAYLEQLNSIDGPQR
jgi:hypothetical protein